MFWNTKRQDKRDERAAQALVDLADDLSIPAKASGILRSFLSLNLLIWLIVLLLPNFVFSFFERLGGFGGKISLAMLVIPGIAAFFLIYAMIRLEIPDVDDNKTLSSELLGSLDYRASADKRF
jgi:hypothetical protein